VSVRIVNSGSDKSYSPFTFLKVDHTVRNKDSMTRTGASTNPGGITVFAIGVPAIYGSMIAAPGFLNADQNSHQGIFI
jgi:hypothetical protein